MTTALQDSTTLPVAQWRTADLNAYVGGLSTPSKMPGFSYSLPAVDCQVGGKLRNVEGSTCSSCYAHKGRYAFGNVQAALRRRADSLDQPLWVEVMAELIGRKSHKVPYFRWHDSGDLQSVEHFARICAVCRLTPNVQHWLPTREYRYVSEYVAAGNSIPKNLNVRLSAHMVGGHVPTFPRLRGLVTTSTVSTSGAPDSHDCPSRHQGNSCGDCRACWDSETANVDYRLH